MGLILRPFTVDDETVARAARPAFAGTDFSWLFDLAEDDAWETWLARMDGYARGVDLPADRVRAAALAADDDGTLVGAVSVRFALNDFLARRGGHIGYGVIPEHRGKGYATAMLTQAVDIAKAGGVDDVLLTVADDNPASIRVIERCGGRLEAVVADDPTDVFRRYWF